MDPKPTLEQLEELRLAYQEHWEAVQLAGKILSDEAIAPSLPRPTKKLPWRTRISKS